MKNNWFKNWSLKRKFDPNIIILKLPNSATQKTFIFRAGRIIKIRDIVKLEGILASCFDQIQRDNGGYEKEKCF